MAQCTDTTICDIARWLWGASPSDLKQAPLLGTPIKMRNQAWYYNAPITLTEVDGEPSPVTVCWGIAKRNTGPEYYLVAYFPVVELTVPLYSTTISYIVNDVQGIRNFLRETIENVRRYGISSIGHGGGFTSTNAADGLLQVIHLTTLSPLYKQAWVTRADRQFVRTTNESTV